MKTTRRDFLEPIRNPSGLGATLRNQDVRLNRIERAKVKFNFNKPDPPKKAPQPDPAPTGTQIFRSFAFGGATCGVRYDGGGGGISQLELGDFLDALTPTDATITPTSLYWVAGLFLKWEGDTEPDIDWAVTGAIAGATLINSISISDHAKVYAYQLETIPGGVGRVRALFTVEDAPFNVSYAGMITYGAENITSSTTLPDGELLGVQLMDFSAETSFNETRHFGPNYYFGFVFAVNTDLAGFTIDVSGVVDPDGVTSDVGIANRNSNVGTAAVANNTDFTYTGSWAWTDDPHQLVLGLINVAPG